MSVYLVGGTANAGKSRCAQSLSDRHGLVHLETDPIRQRLEAEAEPSDPLRAFLTCEWLTWSPDAYVRQAAQNAARVSREAIVPLVQREIAQGSNLIVEGVDLTPQAAEALLQQGAAGAVFLTLREETIIRERFRMRDRTGGCLSGNPSLLNAFVDLYFAYAQHLTEEAKHLGISVQYGGSDDVCNQVQRALGIPQ